MVQTNNAIKRVKNKQNKRDSSKEQFFVWFQ